MSVETIQSANGSLATLKLFYYGVTGNLCTGLGVKKKKKMMYVTTKNAGKCLISLFLLLKMYISSPSLSEMFLFINLLTSFPLTVHLIHRV